MRYHNFIFTAILYSYIFQIDGTVQLDMLQTPEAAHEKHIITLCEQIDKELAEYNKKFVLTHTYYSIHNVAILCSITNCILGFTESSMSKKRSIYIWGSLIFGICARKIAEKFDKESQELRNTLLPKLVTLHSLGHTGQFLTNRYKREMFLSDAEFNVIAIELNNKINKHAN